jgi:hypothetical protein
MLKNTNFFYQIGYYNIINMYAKKSLKNLKVHKIQIKSKE